MRSRQRESRRMAGVSEPFPSHAAHARLDTADAMQVEAEEQTAADKVAVAKVESVASEVEPAAEEAVEASEEGAEETADAVETSEEEEEEAVEASLEKEGSGVHNAATGRRKFSEMEDEAILRWRRNNVPWATIASRLPDRTVASVKARFRSRLKEAARLGLTLAAFDAFTFVDEGPSTPPRKSVSPLRRQRPGTSDAAAQSTARYRHPSPRRTPAADIMNPVRAFVRCGTPPPPRWKVQERHSTPRQAASPPRLRNLLTASDMVATPMAVAPMPPPQTTNVPMGIASTDERTDEI